MAKMDQFENNSDRKPALVSSGIMPAMSTDQELDSALSQMGITSHMMDTQQAVGPMHDATLMLQQLMDYPAGNLLDGSSAAGHVPFLTALPDNFMGTTGQSTAGVASHHSQVQTQAPTLNLPQSGPFVLPATGVHASLPQSASPGSARANFGIGAVGGVGVGAVGGVQVGNAGLSLGQGAAGTSLPVAGAPSLSKMGSTTNMAVQSPGSAISQYEEEERQKREMHNFIERRRRYNINDRIKELGSLLPGSEPDTRQNKGNILKTAVNYIKRLQKIEARHRELSRKHRQYAKTLTVFKSRLEEYDAACQSNGIVVPSASQEAALLTRVDLARVTLDQCVTLVDCLESTGSEVSDVSSMGQVSDDEGWSEDDDLRSNASTHSTNSRKLQKQ